MTIKCIVIRVNEKFADQNLQTPSLWPVDAARVNGLPRYLLHCYVYVYVCMCVCHVITGILSHDRAAENHGCVALPTQNPLFFHVSPCPTLVSCGSQIDRPAAGPRFIYKSRQPGFPVAFTRAARVAAGVRVCACACVCVLCACWSVILKKHPVLDELRIAEPCVFKVGPCIVLLVFLPGFIRQR